MTGRCLRPARRALLTRANLALRWLGSPLLAGLATPVRGASPPPPPLDAAQSAAFRAWFVAIVEDQVLRGPAAQWQHRDCAGLVRFAVNQALRVHDERWMQAIGWDRRRPRPPALQLSPQHAAQLGAWTLVDGRASAYASAIALVQHNCRFVDKTRTQAMPGDLLFFDQGDDQHLMVWTGRRIAYHTGAQPPPASTDDARRDRASASDHGLRHLRWEQLLAHPDTRWRPRPDNSNFAGLFRLAFLGA